MKYGQDIAFEAFLEKLKLAAFKEAHNSLRTGF